MVFTLPLRPWESVQFLSCILREIPWRLAFTTGSLIDSRPCFLMSIFLLLAMTTLRAAGPRLLHRKWRTQHVRQSTAVFDKLRPLQRIIQPPFYTQLPPDCTHPSRIHFLLRGYWADCATIGLGHDNRTAHSARRVYCMYNPCPRERAFPQQKRICKRKDNRSTDPI